MPLFLRGRAAGRNPSGDPHRLAIVGTYTSHTASQGLYASDFDPATGQLRKLGLAALAVDPSWVAIHPNGRWAYAANEAGPQSTVTAFSLDARTGKLVALNRLPSLGEDPCYLSFDKTGKFLFVANYTSGTVAVFPILEDGKLGEHTAVARPIGTPGPVRERQEGPHAHWAETSADNRFLLVADLGLDAILLYRFEPADGTLRPADPPAKKLAPGSGPRHAAFSSDGRYLYVLSELNSTVSAFCYEPSSGALRELQVVSTLPEGFRGRSEAAEIVTSQDWLFASNRGPDTLARFRRDPVRGTLTEAGFVPSGGKEPRHFTLDPAGRYLLAENQNSDSIVVYRLDPATGTLSLVSRATDIPSPVCLAFR